MLLIIKFIGNEKNLSDDILEIINFYFSVNITKYFGERFNLKKICNTNNINIPSKSFKEWSIIFWNKQKIISFEKRNPISDIYDPHPNVDGFIHDAFFPWNDHYTRIKNYIISRMKIKEKNGFDMEDSIYKFNEAWILSGRKIMKRDARRDKFFLNYYGKKIIKDITY